MMNQTKDLGSKIWNEFRTETDSLGEVKVPSDKLWGRKHNVPWSILASATI